MKKEIQGCILCAGMFAGMALPAVAQNTDNAEQINLQGINAQLGNSTLSQEHGPVAGTPRVIDQEPLSGIVSPSFRFIGEEPDVGGPGDVFNVTNVNNYENTVAGNVYSPILSTENVNKLYVDNSLKYITNQFITEITNIKQDIRNVTTIMSGVCEDIQAVQIVIGDLELNGADYEWNAALGEHCGNISWNFDKSILELITNYGYEHGCFDARASLSRSYRYNGENIGHSTWSFAHNNAHSRSVMFKPDGWVDTDNDGRDDDSYTAYKAGYDTGFEICEPDVASPVVTYVETETPILLTRHNYNASKSRKRTGNYYRGPDHNPNRDWQVGDYAYYSGVASTGDGISIDAKITMLANDDNAYVSMSVNSYKNNVLNIYGNSSSDDKEVDFKIEFLNGNNGAPVSLRSTLTTADLDGVNVGKSYGYSEDVIYEKSDISSYSVVSGSDVKVVDLNGRVRASGNGLNDSGSSGETNDQEHWFSVVFEGSSVRFSLSPRTSSSGFGFNGRVMQQNAVITYPDGTVVHQ